MYNTSLSACLGGEELFHSPPNKIILEPVASPVRKFIITNHKPKFPTIISPPKSNNSHIESSRDPLNSTTSNAGDLVGPPLVSGGSPSNSHYMSTDTATSRNGSTGSVINGLERNGVKTEGSIASSSTATNRTVVTKITTSTDNQPERDPKITRRPQRPLRPKHFVPSSFLSRLKRFFGFQRSASKSTTRSTAAPTLTSSNPPNFNSSFQLDQSTSITDSHETVSNVNRRPRRLLPTNYSGEPQSMRAAALEVLEDIPGPVQGISWESVYPTLELSRWQQQTLQPHEKFYRKSVELGDLLEVIADFLQQDRQERLAEQVGCEYNYPEFPLRDLPGIAAAPTIEMQDSDCFDGRWTGASSFLLLSANTPSSMQEGSRSNTRIFSKNLRTLAAQTKSMLSETGIPSSTADHPNQNNAGVLDGQKRFTLVEKSVLSAAAAGDSSSASSSSSYWWDTETDRRTAMEFLFNSTLFESTSDVRVSVKGLDKLINAAGSVKELLLRLSTLDSLEARFSNMAELLRAVKNAGKYRNQLVTVFDVISSSGCELFKSVEMGTTVTLAQLHGLLSEAGSAKRLLVHIQQFSLAQMKFDSLEALVGAVRWQQQVDYKTVRYKLESQKYRDLWVADKNVYKSIRESFTYDQVQLLLNILGGLLPVQDFLDFALSETTCRPRLRFDSIASLVSFFERSSKRYQQDARTQKKLRDPKREKKNKKNTMVTNTLPRPPSVSSSASTQTWSGGGRRLKGFFYFGTHPK